jgi:ADP-ribosylglycohydrolase
MLGAIAGDMIGSVFESAPVKTKHFPLLSASSTFTDDTVLTVAIADALLGDGDFDGSLRGYHRRYPDRGYGAGFQRWAASPAGSQNFSFGNGSAMRVSPVAWAFDSLESVLSAAGRSAATSHNHAEGIRGAKAVAASVFLARTGAGKQAIRDFVTENFAYDLGRSLDAIRPTYEFDVTCAGSVPEAIVAFLESRDFEDAVRNAVSLGGDSDTMACIAGAIAEAFYGPLPEHLSREVGTRLPVEFGAVIDRFQRRFMFNFQRVMAKV